ncbi:MAG: hypothetical protein IPK42_24755 [Betaproteobacteria bacterium]|nr:hypothetical protein [Betaproteobacteria bacterium]
MAADVKTHLYEWSTTESSNLPVGSTVVSTNLDDNLRMIQKVVRDLSAPTTLAAAGTTDLGSKDETFITLTGTAATVTALGTVSAGIYKWVIFNAAHVLTHNATSLILPSAANITAASGDVACFVSLGSGNWRCVSYTRASGNNVLNASTFSDGTVGAPSITFAADLDTGLYRSGTNTVNVAAGGASVASFAAAVGITPTTTFTVSGGTTITLTPGEGSALTINPLGTGVTGGDSKRFQALAQLQAARSNFKPGQAVLHQAISTSGAMSPIALRSASRTWGIGLAFLAAAPNTHRRLLPVAASPTIVGSDIAFKITLGATPGTLRSWWTFIRIMPMRRW